VYAAIVVDPSLVQRGPRDRVKDYRVSSPGPTLGCSLCLFEALPCSTRALSCSSGVLSCSSTLFMVRWLRRAFNQDANPGCHHLILLLSAESRLSIFESMRKEKIAYELAQRLVLMAH
jgi:hypothetical protein